MGSGKNPWESLGTSPKKGPMSLMLFYLRFKAMHSFGEGTFSETNIASKKDAILTEESS